MTLLAPILGAVQFFATYRGYRFRSTSGYFLPPLRGGNRALQIAALHPASGDWLYFITVKPHETRFTKSFKEFDGWVTLYNNNVANGLFK